MEATSLIVPSISLAIAAASLYVSVKRASKNDVEKIQEDAVKLEHRLTLLESNQYTNSDRQCLQELHAKMSLLWDSFKTLPDFLKKHSTPDLDGIWRKAKQDITSLTVEEASKLIEAMDREIANAVKSEKNPTRAFIATIYKTVLKYELERPPNACK